MIRSRRLALTAAAVIVGLTAAACGDDTAQQATTETVAGATPPVIKIGAGGGGNVAGAPAAESADRMMMPYAVFSYVFQGEMPALDGSAPAWRFPAGGPVDTARVAAIAAVLGVEGDLRELAADMGGGWMVGPEDYSDATLTVSADGMLSWWFSPAPQAMPGVVCVEPALVDPAVGGGTDGSSGDVPAETMPVEPRCEEPQPPAGVPDAATAEQKAKDLFAAMGFDTSAYVYDVYADEWGANVTAWMMLGGVRAPATLSVGFGAEGAVTWASGVLAEPEAVGEYPLVGTAAGLERLNDESGQWLWYGGPAVMARATTGGGVAVDDVAAAPVEEETAPPETAVAVTGDEALPPPEETGGEMPPPEEITITFTDVELGLTQIWDADNTVWLLPSYVFSAADGGEWMVIAVDDSFIEMPPMPEPLPIEPMPEPLPVETIAPDTPTDPGAPTEMPEPIDPAAAEVLVGLTEDEATKVAEENGWTLRVARADGVDFAVTADYSPTRVNVELTAGVVSAVLSVG